MTDTATIAEHIREALKAVVDPEIHLNVIDLGLIYDIAVNDDGKVTVTMTLTTPGCPMASSLAHAVGRAAARVPGVTGVHIQLTFNPPWTPDRITPEGRMELMNRRSHNLSPSPR